MRGFPGDSVVKNLPSNAGDTENMGLIPGSGRSPEVGNGNSLQHSCLENSMDNWATQQSRTRPGTITAPGEPYKVKNTPSQYVGGINDGKLKEWGRRWSSPPPHFPFDYKNLAHQVLGAVLPCLLPWVSHKSPIQINSLLTCLSASSWILPVLRQKNPCSSESQNSFCGFVFTFIHVPLSPPLTSGNHKSDLFIYEFVCLFVFEA